MSESPTFVLLVEWDETARPGLPRVIGPFPTFIEAEDFAKMNVGNGRWRVEVLSYPYARSQRL